MTDQPIRQYPDELREKAETDMLRVHPPAICELPHPTIAEEEECERERLADVPELTAEEARDLADDLGLQLYRAQDALAFVEECCVIAEREGRTITVADVREWLKGAQCGRQLSADAALVVDPAEPPVHLVTWTGPGNSAEQRPRTTPNNPATSGDTADNQLHRLRTQLAAERDKARRGDEHPRPDLDHLRVTAHNGIAAGLEIALGYVDHQLRAAGEAAGNGPSIDEAKADDRRWPLESEGE